MVLADPRDGRGCLSTRTPLTRLQQVDGLRGIAMLFVFFGHFAGIWTGLMRPEQAPGLFLRLVDADATLGSSFFMLLSGFFVYSSQIRAKRSFAEFLRGRMWRIYPLYLVMTIVYIAGSLLLPNLSKLPADPHDAAIFILESLFLLPGILHVNHPPLMDVSWTLSFIVVFYFIEAGLARLFLFFRVSRPVRLVILVSAAIFWILGGDVTGWWPSRTCALWVGMAMAEAIGPTAGERMNFVRRLVLPAAVVTLAGIGARTWLMMERPEIGMFSLMTYRAAITSVALSAFFWCAYYGPEWWTRLLSAPRLLELGKVSYSFYLTHGLAVKVFRWGVVPLLGSAAVVPAVFWVCQIAGLALAIQIARVVYAVVENPLANLRPKVVRVRREQVMNLQVAETE